ncbi:MAG TPA: four helix bundle protein [Myxococcaceae bacterium]|nr:four helix bundle protein [Myxococcaceae bacterium]
MGGELEAGAVDEEVVFDHEKLDVYRVTRELVTLISSLLKRNVHRDLREQVDRSSTSILFNIAEGAGKTAQADKQRFYEIARGSATETAAQLDVLHIRGVMTTEEYRTARLLLLRVVQMLSRLSGGSRRS